MAWFQTGYQVEKLQTGASQQNQVLEDKRGNLGGERVALGELNRQQGFRDTNLMSLPSVSILGASKGWHNQGNGHGQVAKQVSGKGARKAQKQPLGGQGLSVQIAAREFSQTSLRSVVKNIDADDADILACSGLASNIMRNLFLAEATKLPSPDYMEMGQPDITPEMRSILIDWLVEVAQEYKLVQETLHLCVRMIDRFLSLAPVQRNKLQLVGVTCMFIASKFEEIYPPQVHDFSYITEETYSKQEIIDFERVVLLTLDFELNLPTMRLFLNRFFKAALADIPVKKHDGRLEALSSYIAELSLLEYTSLRVKPSMIAAATVFLAQWCLHNAPWSQTLQHYSSYTAPQLRHTVQFLHAIYIKARTNELPAVREKYSHPRYLCVAGSVPPATLPESIFLPQNVL